MSEFVLPGADTDKYIWIIRKGNGQAHVYPSPAVVKVGGRFQIVNRTDDEATVSFPAGVIDRPPFSVAPGAAELVSVVACTQPYVDYDVTFGPGRYAEGGSKPGVIIEH